MILIIATVKIRVSSAKTQLFTTTGWPVSVLHSINVKRPVQSQTCQLTGFKCVASASPMRNCVASTQTGLRMKKLTLRSTQVFWLLKKDLRTGVFAQEMIKTLNILAKMAPTGMSLLASALSALCNAWWAALKVKPWIQFLAVAPALNKRISTSFSIQSGQHHRTCPSRSLMVSLCSLKIRGTDTRYALTSNILGILAKMAHTGTSSLASASLSRCARCYVRKVKSSTHLQTVSVAVSKK